MGCLMWFVKLLVAVVRAILLVSAGSTRFGVVEATDALDAIADRRRGVLEVRDGER